MGVAGRGRDLLPLRVRPCSDGCRVKLSSCSRMSISRLGTGVPKDDQQTSMLVAVTVRSCRLRLAFGNCKEARGLDLLTVFQRDVVGLLDAESI